MAHTMTPPSAPAAASVDHRLWAARIKADIQSNYHYEMAKGIAREGNASAAAMSYEQAIASSPGWSLPYIGLIQLLDRQEKPAESEAVRRSARSAIAAFDKEAEFFMLIEEIAQLQEAGRLDVAAELIEKTYLICKADPPVAFLVTKLGDACLAQALALPWAELGKASEFLLRKIEFDPWSSLAHEQLGIRLHTLRKFDEAKNAYEKLLSLQPRAINFARLSNVHALMLRFTEAEQSARQALELDSREKEALLWLGVSFALRSRLDEAQAALESALAIDPDYPSVLIELGLLRLQQGRNSEAEKLLTKAFALSETRPKFPLYLGLFWLRTGNTARSIEIFREAAENYPKSGVLQSNLGLALQIAGQEEEAFACHQQAMQLEPELMPFWIAHRAWAAEYLEPVYARLGLVMPVQPE